MIIKYDKVPISTQHVYGYIAYGKHKLSKYMTQKAKQFKKDFLASIKKQLPKNFSPLKGELTVNYELTFPDKRHRDIDNYCKIVFDSMNKVVYDDDSQITKLTIVKKYKKGCEGIKLIIKN